MHPHTCLSVVDAGQRVNCLAPVGDTVRVFTRMQPLHRGIGWLVVAVAGSHTCCWCRVVVVWLLWGLQMWSCGAESIIRVWRTQDFTNIRALEGHTGYVLVAQLPVHQPDHALVVYVCCVCACVCVWAVDSWVRCSRCGGWSPIGCGATGPETRRLTSGGKTAAALVVATPVSCLRWHRQPIACTRCVPVGPGRMSMLWWLCGCVAVWLCGCVRGCVCGCVCGCVFDGGVLHAHSR